MNRAGLGLAVGAGYVLGRTKKLKLAFAVGTLVAGRRMHLSPRVLADLVSGQLRNNPQFKEIGDQLREDLRGVGKAASGAMVERQIDALADRLHGRTAQVRDQLAGVVPDASGLGSGNEEAGEREEDREDQEGAQEYDEPDAEPDEAPDGAPDEEAPAPRRKAAAKKAPPPAKKAAKKATAKTAPAKKAAKAAGKTPGGKAPAKKAAAKKPAAKKATAAKSTARGTRARLPRGGGER
ncbi:DNA primase [Streptomyces sp. NPDC002838]|uniref:DNA primase n=1 Tax=Streptomyces sp. NPDC002838 TaxID=3154436 RepID=UPI003331F875